MVYVSEGLLGLLRSLFCCFSAVVPVCVVRGWPEGAAGLLWIIAGGVRAWKGDEGIKTDCAIFLGVGLVSERKELWRMFKEVNVGVEMGFTGLRVGTITLGIAISLAVLVRSFWRRSQNKEGITKPLYGLPPDLKMFDIKHPGPLIFPCRTTHARVFPKRHAFGYSYLLYGIPITPAEVAADGTGYRYGDDSKSGKWWLQIRAEDHLGRGYGSIGLYNKLKWALKDRGVQDSEWSYAYLVTAPRFFGYSFNPVSFWYIYDRSNELKYMILEVNNTFSERRIYLLDGSGPPTPPQTPDAELKGVEAKMRRFTDHWEKDFHVSPFNSRKGSYSLKALDPFPIPNVKQTKLDNTITLKSSKDHAKIVARVYSTGPPLDALNLGFVDTVRFVGGWWWVGLLTFPRILKEAFRLFFKRSLHVWFRPEVLSTSIARVPGATEIAMQKIFREYLQHLVWQSSEQWNIVYHTAIPDRSIEHIATTYIPGRPIRPKKLEIRILSPVFYTRFVHYAHTSEAFDRECLFTDERNRTLWISNPELLPLLLPKAKSPPPPDGMEWNPKRSRFDELRWHLLRKLRCPPAEPAYVVTPTSSKFDVDDIRTLPYSDLDTHARSINGHFIASLYRRTVTRIFLAQRFAFGFVELVDALDLVARTVLCYVGAKTMANVLTGSMSRKDWWWIVSLGARVCVCHLYGIVKGYR